MRLMPCANCGTELVGPYCHNCGQNADNPLASLRHFLRHTIADEAQLSSGTLASFRGLIKPGYLTQQYVAGRRVRFLSPLQLYLLAAALFFLFSSVRPLVDFNPRTHWVKSTLGVMSAGGHMDDSQVLLLQQRGISMALFQERFTNQVNANLPTFLILSVILFTLAMRVMYPKHPFRLMQHAVFALHWISFFLLIMIVDRLFNAPGSPQVYRAPVTIITVVYLYMALKRVYGQSSFATAGKTVLVYTVFNIIISLWVVGVMALAFQVIR
jgi:hypothetical protein